MYDIIGDVHGHAKHLKKLLLQLGYTKGENGYSHPERKAIFAGDFINRGPQIRKAVKIVRKMVENGNALAILGNHELNTLVIDALEKEDKAKKNGGKDLPVIPELIKDYSSFEKEWKSHIKWMKSLPLFLEMENFRVVHACWSDEAVEYLKMNLPQGKLKGKILRSLHQKPESEVSKRIWLLTKGVYFKMPGDLKIKNNKGVSPRSFRTKWWENPDGKSFGDINFESKYNLPDYTIPKQILPPYFPYSENQPPLFFGHYCRGEGPFIIQPNLCCTDSCVTGTKVLTAYRWNGNQKVSEEGLLQVKI